MNARPTFAARIAELASTRADSTAIEAGAVRLSYGELDLAVRSLASVLRHRGVAPGAIVAMTARGEVDHLVATLALLSLGVAQVALASRDPADARARLARRVGATHVLGERAEDEVAGATLLELAEAQRAARERRSPLAMSPADADAPALYLTGSGTTGEPKVVAYSQRQLAAHAQRCYYGTGRERVLRLAHVEYNNSKRLRLYTLWLGGTCVLRDRSTDPVHGLCARHRVNWLELSTMHGYDLLAAGRDLGPLPSGTAIRVGGSRVPIALRRALIAEVARDLYVSYGATEVANVSVADPSMHDDRESVGRPGEGVEVEVVRADGTRAVAGEIGEIRIRAAGMATGYVGDEVATARHFRDGWFMPGDLASQEADGQLCLHGRKDDMMILNGINIFPAEIERVLEAHPAVASAVALPLASAVHGQIPVAAVELKDGVTCGGAELLAYARAALGVRAPRRVEVVAVLPRNAQGKVVTRELALRFGASGA